MSPRICCSASSQSTHPVYPSWVLPVRISWQTMSAASLKLTISTVLPSPIQVVASSQVIRLVKHNLLWWIHADYSWSCSCHPCAQRGPPEWSALSPAQGLMWGWLAVVLGCICFLPVLRHLCWSAGPFRADHECLAVMSPRSLSTHECVPSGPMDLWISSLPKCPPTHSSLRKSSLQHSLTQVCCLSVQTDAKKVLPNCPLCILYPQGPPSL